MRHILHFSFFAFALYSFVFSSCTTKNSSAKKRKVDAKHEKVEAVKKPENAMNTEDFDMSNPAFMMGTNLGTLFKTYYVVGDFNKMLTYTASTIVKTYGREKLMSIYRSLDFGFDMKLKNMTTEGNEKILHYEIVINATKQVKRLHVVIENDTARIVPQHLEKGDIFE